MAGAEFTLVDGDHTVTAFTAEGVSGTRQATSIDPVGAGNTVTRVVAAKTWAYDPQAGGSNATSSVVGEYGYNDRHWLTAVTDPRPGDTPVGRS